KQTRCWHVTAGNGVDREECDLVTTLWDTTGTAVVKALAAERRTGGAVTSGNALTLVVVVDERDVHEAEEAATLAASKHPMRMLMVIRRHIDAPVPRLDAEVLMGGRLGPGPSAGCRGHDGWPARPGRGGRHADARTTRAARRVGHVAPARTRCAGRRLVARAAS